MFSDIKKQVAANFKSMAAGELFYVNIDREKIWELYLAGFSESERQEYTCNSCRSFLRQYGGIVSIVGNRVVSLWDGVEGQAAANVAEYIHSLPITDVFRNDFAKCGTDKNYDMIKQVNWNHLFIEIPQKFVLKNNIDAVRGEMRTTKEMLKRALDEFSVSTLETVLELIAQNSLYRGKESEDILKLFRQELLRYKIIPEEDKDANAWLLSTRLTPAVCRLRGTAIGTLLVNIEEGMELDMAVTRFEAMVAPANYKRPTALVTKAMIELARKTVDELGLTPALERRYATIEDITVNNVLFADRSARKSMKANVFDNLSSEVAVNPKSFDKVEEVTIEKFLSDVLPTAKAIEVMMENRHTTNLVSLVAPADPDANKLFKWDSAFSWSYNGDVADSLREKVSAAGGRVDGVLRFSHSWNHVGRNASLMDLHVFMPGSSEHNDGCHNHYPTGQRVGWNNRNDRYSGGVQDVDYILEAPNGFIPVENITFPMLDKLKDGKYTFKIHNWNFRQPTTSGFKAEIEFEGQMFQYEMSRPLKQKEWVTVAEATLKNGHFTIEHKMESSTSSKKVWALNTHTFQRVNVIMFSPNHWDGNQTGNKHFFFMLDGCLNEGVARGFYNEFLKQELTPHRKVLEMVGSKMKTETSDRQLSGLGFSETQRNNLVVRVTGNTQRIINVKF
jgi:hypothetical protein